MYTIDENYPKEDNELKFDNFLGQYVLKGDSALNRIAVDENIAEWARTSEQYGRILNEVSDDIYRFIESHTSPQDIYAKKQLLNSDPDFVNVVKRAMLAQLRYYLRSGGGAVKDMHGVDVLQSRAMDLSKIRGDRQLSPDAITLLSNHPLALYVGPIRRWFRR